MPEPLETDYLVIGSGIAGLNFALLAAEHGRVVVLTKKQPDDTNTNWAQGGVAAVLSSADSFEQHVADTLTAGDGLCDRDVVEMCVAAGPAQVQRLLDIGVRLDRGPSGQLDLGREGAHTHHRVVHWQDMTGREIQRALLAAVSRTSNITVLDDHIAVDLLSMAKYGGDPACFGAYVLDRQTGKVKTLLQTFGIGLFVIPRWTLPFPELWEWVASVVLGAAVVVTVVTGIDYLHQAIRLRRTSERAVRKRAERAERAERAARAAAARARRPTS